MDLLARWSSKVDFDGPTTEGIGKCWLWTDSCIPKGYGRFKVGIQSRMAHDVGYELHVGPVPDGLELDHLCRVRSCVNPSHLEPVTHHENVLRGEGLAAINARKVECMRGHDLTDPANLVPTKSVRRQCRACRNLLRRERRALVASRVA